MNDAAGRPPRSVVRAGNGTIEAAAEEGIEEVLIVRPAPGQLVAVQRDDWTPTEATAYAVSDNRTAELAEWDEQGLAETLPALVEEDKTLLEAIGYLDDELRELIDACASEPDPGAGDPGAQVDRAEELLAKWGVKPGDLWVIPSKATPGKEHRLLCGDSTKAEDVAKVMGREKAHGAFTSPPYAEQRKEQYGGVPANEYVDWWWSIQEAVRLALHDDGSFFVNIKAHAEEGERHLYVMDLVLAMRRQWGWRYIDEFCWERNGLPGSPERMGRFRNAWESVHWFASGQAIRFRPDHVRIESDTAVINSMCEPALSARQGTGQSHVSKEAQGFGLAYPSNRLPVFSYHVESGGHEAAFPVGLPEFFVKAFSDPGDTWLEPFAGSGTTIVAAEQTGRLCRGIEIAPKYVAVALERLANMGLEPVPRT